MSWPRSSLWLHQRLLFPESAHSIVGEAKNTLLTLDWSLTCQEANTHPSLSCLCSKNMEDSWGNLWNCALDRGPAGTKIAQATLTRPIFGNRTCPHCSQTIQQQSFTSHLSDDHDVNIDAICEAVKSDPHSLFSPPLHGAIRQFT